MEQGIVHMNEFPSPLIARHGAAGYRRLNRNPFDQPGSNRNRRSFLVVDRDAVQMLMTFESLHRPFQLPVGSALDVGFKIARQAVSNLFGMTFEIAAQTLLLRAHLFPREAKSGQGDSQN